MNGNAKRQAQTKDAGHIFGATRWTVVVNAMGGSATALNSLCATYRSPVLVWLRCRGVKPDQAEDLVQGFFAQLLRRDFLAEIAREKGRFRTFLLTAFRNYLADQRDRENALKRGGGRAPDSLDETDGEGQALRDPPSPAVAPDAAYDRAWAQALLARALERLREECRRTGHGALGAALEPVLFADPDAPAYAAIGRALGMTEGAVKMAASRIRKRLRTLLREEVLETLAAREELEDELRYLRSLFGRTGGPA